MAETRTAVMELTDKDIAQKVDEILNETYLLSTPVEVVNIANFYGFTVYEMNMSSDISGLIMVDDKDIEGFDTNKIIVINKKHPATRQRFTIAHELGHYFLENKPSRCFSHREDASKYDKKERDANRFASALLMPESSVRRTFEDISGSYTTSAAISIVASKFNVSNAAAEIRLKTLKLI